MSERKQWAGQWELVIMRSQGNSGRRWMRRYWDGRNFRWHRGPSVP